MIRTASFTFLLPFLAAALPAQNASATIFGTGCQYNGQNLSIGVQGLPQLGTTFTLTYSGPNMQNQLTVQPVLVFGFGTTNFPIPQGILPTQPPNCLALVTGDVLNLMPPLATGGFQAHLDFTVPNANALIGFQFAAQWLAIAVQCGFVPPCALTALPTSDAVLLTVGL